MTLDSHTNTKFSRGCLLVKMASKTVARSIKRREDKEREDRAKLRKKREKSKE